MDVADAPTSDGVMIALLPTSSDWCNIELPHLTLVYAGTKDTLKPADSSALAKDAAALAAISSPFSLRVMGVDVFGPPEDRVKVLRFQATPELMSMRRFVEKWNVSQFPFQPHATIGPADQFVEIIPSFVGFDRIMVGWGDEPLVFSMR